MVKLLTFYERFPATIKGEDRNIEKMKNVAKKAFGISMYGLEKIQEFSDELIRPETLDKIAILIAKGTGIIPMKDMQHQKLTVNLDHQKQEFTK